MRKGVQVLEGGAVLFPSLWGVFGATFHIDTVDLIESKGSSAVQEGTLWLHWRTVSRCHSVEIHPGHSWVSNWVSNWHHWGPVHRNSQPYTWISQTTWCYSPDETRCQIAPELKTNLNACMAQRFLGINQILQKFSSVFPIKMFLKQSQACERHPNQQLLILGKLVNTQGSWDGWNCKLKYYMCHIVMSPALHACFLHRGRVIFG